MHLEKSNNGQVKLVWQKTSGDSLELNVLAVSTEGVLTDTIQQVQITKPVDGWINPSFHLRGTDTCFMLWSNRISKESPFVSRHLTPFSTALYGKSLKLHTIRSIK